MDTQVWLGLFTLLGVIISAYFQFRTAQVMYQTKVETAQKLGEIHENTNGSLGGMEKTIAGLTTQLQTAGITPTQTVLKGATNAPADDVVATPGPALPAPD